MPVTRSRPRRNHDGSPSRWNFHTNRNRISDHSISDPDLVATTMGAQAVGTSTQTEFEHAITPPLQIHSQNPLIHRSYSFHQLIIRDHQCSHAQQTIEAITSEPLMVNNSNRDFNFQPSKHAIASRLNHQPSVPVTPSSITTSLAIYASINPHDHGSRSSAALLQRLKALTPFWYCIGEKRRSR